jgi:hypothetical protein
LIQVFDASSPGGTASELSAMRQNGTIRRFEKTLLTGGLRTHADS